MSRAAPQAKNRSAAQIQISAEHLLREAKDRRLEDLPAPPKQYIADSEELRAYQHTKRKEFEDGVRNNRNLVGFWTKYAVWEASQGEYERSRSVYERALEVAPRETSIWLKYAEMEMKAQFINHARNIFDRVVTILPRIDVFWYKYVYMEELVGAIDLARLVFERWMKWMPNDDAWASYIKFEMRQGDVARARQIYDRYTDCHPTPRAYLKYAKWEERQKELGMCRAVYEKSLQVLLPEQDLASIYKNFAKFEERCKEFDRARVIYKYAINQGQLGDTETMDLKQDLLNFEKRCGDKKGIENAVSNKRRNQYELLVKENSYDYDTWFDYISLEEAVVEEQMSVDSGGDGLNESMDLVRAVYERAVACVPVAVEKGYWRRYIYLWIKYALFEELVAKDADRTRAVYKACLKVIPHEKFTFTKIWVLAAHFEVRQKDLTAARKLLGQAIGRCGTKKSLYRHYIDLESQLGEVERCRKIHLKCLENVPSDCHAWIKFATLERDVGETARARAIYELAIEEVAMNMPELVWKAYIDFEVENAELGKARELYERMLQRTTHVKAWISYALFEVGQVESDTTNAVTENDGDAHGAISKARDIFTRADSCLKEEGLKEERVQLLNTWRDVELSLGDSGNVSSVDSKMPRRVKKKRVNMGDGMNTREEFYYDYEFPDDEKKVAGLKLFQNAQKWKAALVSKEIATVAEQEVGESVEAQEEIDIDDV
jgi:crooked neck